MEKIKNFYHLFGNGMILTGIISIILESVYLALSREATPDIVRRNAVLFASTIILISVKLLYRA